MLFGDDAVSLWYTFNIRAMKYVLILLFSVVYQSCSAHTNSTVMSKDNIIALVRSNDVEAVKKLLSVGADVNAVDEDQNNLVLIATHNRNVEMAKILVEHGADVNQQAKNLDSAFLYAGASGQTELVNLYLAHGARFDVFNRYHGSALIPACERGHVETVRVLAATPNFPIDHINRLGWTGLLEAIILGDGSKKYQDIVRILIEHGSDTSIADANGVTPLQHAQAMGQTEIVHILTRSQD